MPNIRSYAQITGLTIPTAFPRTLSPAYTHVDFPWETNPVNWGDNGGLVAMPEAELVMPSVYRVPHNQRQETGAGANPEIKEYPYIEWYPLGVSGTVPRYSYAYPYLNSEVGMENWDEEANTISTFETAIDAQGFTFVYRRTDNADMNLLGGEEPNADPEATHRRMELAWVVGSGSENELGYCLSFPGNGQMLLSYWDHLGDGALTPIKAASGSSGITTTLFGNYATDNQYATIEVLIVGGKMFISPNAQDNPILVDEARIGADGNAIQRISKVRVSSIEHKTFYFAVHPLKFYAATQFDSTQISIGFKSQALPGWDVTPSGGWSDLGEVVVDLVGVDDDGSSDSLKGPIVQYRLLVTLPTEGTYKGLPYAQFAAGIHAVRLHWARGATVYANDAPLSLQPESVVVNQQFDTESLQIRSSANLTFNNWTGFWGSWSQASGQVAVSIGLTRTAIAGETVLGVPNYSRVFTGFGHTQGSVSASEGGSQFTMVCQDRVRQLQSPRWALPWMDGWNSIYAIAYLAQLGGVPIEQMAFAQYVPDDPYDDWGDTSSWGMGVGAYFLPVGFFTSNLTRFSGAGLWEVMSKIAYSIGYQLYFDAYGMLQFHKFRLPFFADILTVKRTFYESDVEAGGAEGCWHIASHKNMDTVRNKAVVVGINSFSPIWEPIVMAATDVGSILNPTSSNFMGYVQPVVWADSQFADPLYAWEACKSILRFLRMPDRRVSLTTWFQPDIYPLDVIGVRSRHAGTIGVKFMVTSVQHSLDSRTQVGRTQVEATAMTLLDPLVDDYGGVVG